MGFLPLTYRRPAYVDKVSFAKDHIGALNVGSDEQNVGSLRPGLSSAQEGIPDALSFDRIMNGGTCGPCTLRDFMSYLIYVEQSAENLQLFLWYRDYVRRFNKTPVSETALAPRWTRAMAYNAAARTQKGDIEKMKRGISIPLGTSERADFEKAAAVHVRSGWPLPKPLHSLATNREGTSLRSLPQATPYEALVQDAFSTAGVKQPFTTQPFRTEINLIIATYLAEDAPRRLDLPAQERQAAIHALSYTTHPSALYTLAQKVENTLRRQAHSNFIRWSIRNGNPARINFAMGLGVVTILLAVTGSIVLTLSGAARGWRALPVIPLIMGIATVIMAVRGMCVVLHGLHHRHARPWELLLDDKPGSLERLSEGKGNFDSFGPRNSHADEPWVAGYNRRCIARKIFDREVWVQEPALRQIQHTIFLQSVLWALLGAGVLTPIFVAAPSGNLF